MFYPNDFDDFESLPSADERVFSKANGFLQAVLPVVGKAVLGAVAAEGASRLFGSGSSSPGVEKSTMATWAPWQRDLAENQLYPSLRQPADQSRNQMYMQSLAALEEWSKNLAQQPDQSDLNMQMEDFLSERLGGIDYENYFRKTVQDPLLKMFRESVMPDISRRYSQSGFYSTQRGGAEERAREDLMDTIGRGRVSMEMEMQRDQLQAAQLALQYEAENRMKDLQELQQMLSLFSVGQTDDAYGRSIEQQRIDNIMKSLTLQGHENIAEVTEGSPGIAPDIMKLIGRFGGVGVAGSSVGSLGSSVPTAGTGSTTLEGWVG